MNIGKDASVPSNDLISRQAAIDALQKEINKGIPPFDDVMGSIRCGVRLARNIIEDLPSAQPEQRWIPCSERLPKEDGQYLITVKYKHVNDSYEDVYAEHGEWFNGGWDAFCFGHSGEVEGILAWQPLPEPYRGGEQE